MFFLLRHIYKSYLNVLIELRPLALFIKKEEDKKKKLEKVSQF